MKKNANEGNSEGTSANMTVAFSVDEAKKVVRKINKLAMKTVEKGAMDIGELVLNEVFQGRLGEACSKDPFKSSSLQMVCKERDLMVNRRRLGEWVRAAALRKELIAKKVECFHLYYSHYAALLQVEDEKELVKLARTASKEQWSVRDLAKAIGKKKSAAAQSGNSVELVQPDQLKAEQLIQAAGDFLALMQDQDNQRLLEDPQELKDRLGFDVRIQLARRIDDLVACISNPKSLLKLARRNISQIEAEALQAYDADVIDVQAVEV